MGRLLSGVQGLVIALSLVLIGALAGLVTAPALSWAADYGNNQPMQQSAYLIAPEPDTEIAVYLQPKADQQRVGYGMAGDAVTVLERVSDNQSLTWHHIRFANPPYGEGWVQGEFISAEAGQQTSSQGQGDRYLGNQSPQLQGNSSRGSAYSQQQNYFPSRQN
ncbi:hypothetical protein C7271_14535 [filamentous cyanobacterium CCP5]|nr:hypothetical protein C7271_14535 [filamentous cyanobacterium CCP5]